MKSILKIIALSMLLGFAGEANMSFAQDGVHIRIAPPARVHEVRGTRPDRNAVWVGGYHQYNASTNSYTWQQGKWDHAPRSGQVWVAPRYRRQHGEYTFTEGRWR